MLQSTIFLEDKNWQMLRGPSRGPGMVITGGVVCSLPSCKLPKYLASSGSNQARHTGHQSAHPALGVMFQH